VQTASKEGSDFIVRVKELSAFFEQGNNAEFTDNLDVSSSICAPRLCSGYSRIECHPYQGNTSMLKLKKMSSSVVYILSGLFFAE
jgi:hypothetical protein